MLLQAPFVNRVNFGNHLQANCFRGIGVEVGTDRGDFAREILNRWLNRGAFYCVDSWAIGYDPEDPTSQRTPEERAEDERVCHEQLDKMAKCVIFKDTSLGAADRIAEMSIHLDFVYLDGDHRPQSFAQDIGTWWPLLREGGILAGHDIICPGEHRGGHGRNLQPILFEFAKANDLDVYLVPEEKSEPWSWYMVK
jgi:hypothetical protein